MPAASDAPGDAADAPGDASGRIRALAGVFIHESAYVDAPCEIGEGTKVWHFAHVQRGARIGRRCVLGQNVNIAENVEVGDGVKIQNNVAVYTGVVVEDDVFLGPSCVLTNVSNPRSAVNRHAIYEPIRLRRGCTVGANATVVPGVTIGRHAFVAAGAVVTRDVADYALVAGTPARFMNWVSRHGHRLTFFDPGGVAVCPESGLRYHLQDDRLRGLDLADDAPLPDDLRTGARAYDTYTL